MSLIGHKPHADFGVSFWWQNGFGVLRRYIRPRYHLHPEGPDAGSFDSAVAFFAHYIINAKIFLYTSLSKGALAFGVPAALSSQRHHKTGMVMCLFSSWQSAISLQSTLMIGYRAAIYAAMKVAVRSGNFHLHVGKALNPTSMLGVLFAIMEVSISEWHRPSAALYFL